jgi:hypothetical protein
MLRVDEIFRKGEYALRQVAECLARSIQLLGEPNAKYVEGGLDPNILRAYGLRDLTIALDASIVYLKVLADLVAMTLPSLFSSHSAMVARRSMTDLRRRVMNNPDNPLHRIFCAESFDWLDSLARPAKGTPRSDSGTDAIRDARIHLGAMIAYGGPGFQQSKSGEWIRLSDEVSAQMTSIEGAHSRDLIGDIRRVTKSLFAFLDTVVREAGKRDAMFDLRTQEFSISGLVYVLEPSDFLKTVLPRVEEVPSTDESSDACSSGR